MKAEPAPHRGSAHAASPDLTTGQARLAAALDCSQPLAGVTHDPVLLVPPTAASADLSYSWNLGRVLPAAGHAVCTVTLPDESLGDIQIASEYVVAAIRQMARQSNRRVAVVGMSQGGLEPRWALRYWPDLRSKVSDVVSLAAPHHGAEMVDTICAQGCPAALWQMRPGSSFLAALNHGTEVVPGPDWTAIYSTTDDVVTPQTGPRPSSALAAAEGVDSVSIAVQALCPRDTATHVGILADPTATALVVDALGHRGPARADRIGARYCGAGVYPGVDEARAEALVGTILPTLLAKINSAPKAPAEPQLAEYARSDAG